MCGWQKLKTLRQVFDKRGICLKVVACSLKQMLTTGVSVIQKAWGNFLQRSCLSCPHVGRTSFVKMSVIKHTQKHTFAVSSRRLLFSDKSSLDVKLTGIGIEVWSSRNQLFLLFYIAQHNSFGSDSILYGWAPAAKAKWTFMSYKCIQSTQIPS